MRPKARESAPVGRPIDISLSLRTTSRREAVSRTLFSASSETPHAADASPTTATTASDVPRRSRAAARPSAAETAVPACPAPKASYGDSHRFWKPERPSVRRSVRKRSARPVSSFHA